MGQLLCVARGPKTDDTQLAPRISPFGVFRRRSFSERHSEITLRAGSLLEVSLDSLLTSLAVQDPTALSRLPPDLSQLLLDALISSGRLTDATVPLLQGLAFYSVALDAYPDPIRDTWVRCLITEALESLDLSRTQIDDFMLSAVPYLPNLRTLKIECCAGVTDAGLALLHRLPALEELSLAGCDGVGPLGLGCVGRVSTLRRLNLDACHKVWGLGPLRRLTALEALDLGWCIAVGDEDAAAVASLTTLKQLRLCHTEMTDKGVLELKVLSELTSLDVGGLGRLSDRAAATLLESLPELRVMSLARCERVGDGAVRALNVNSPPLEDLDLSYTAVTDRGLNAALPALPRLKRLSLESCAITDTGLYYMSTLNRLESLDLSDTRVGNGGAAAIGSLPALQRLNLAFTEINDLGMQRVVKATTLRRLNLDSRHVGDAGAIAVAALPRLEALDLFGTNVTDNGCTALSKCTTLTSLEVCSGAVTDAGVAALSELPALRHLSLSQNWRVTNAAIPSLMRLTGLTALNLSVCRVTSSAVVTLGCLPELAVLGLAGTRVRPSAVTKLMSMNKGLEVKGIPME